MIPEKARTYWRNLRTGSVNRRIFSAMITIVVATAAVKLAAVAKDVMVARAFGLGDDLDAFLIALVIPFFAGSVLGLSFGGAFMPAYIRAREREGPEAARRLFANVMLLGFALLSGCALLLAAGSGPLLKLVAWEFSPEKLALARDLYFLLIPLVILEGQIALWGAVLNARERFALVALSPILTPLFIIATLILFFPGIGVTGLAWGTLVGAVAELAVLGAALARRGLLPVPRWHGAHDATRSVLRQYVPLVLSGAVMSGSTVVDQAMASWLEPGSVAALNYGNKIPGFLAGIGITALGSAVLPYFSELVARGQRAEIIDTLRTYYRAILAIAVPATLLFVVASEWIVRIMFERGAFGPRDTELVAFIQQMYLLQVPFVVLGMIGARLLIAMSKNHLLTLMSAINFAVNIIGNLVLIRWLGVSGIALSTSIMYLVSSIMIFFFVQRSLKHMSSEEVPRPC